MSTVETVKEKLVTITVADPEDEIKSIALERPGYYLESVPGLVVTQSYFDSILEYADGYVITHEPSGCSLVVNNQFKFINTVDAIECIRRLSDVTDWTQGGEVLLSLGIGLKVRQIVESFHAELKARLRG